MIENIQLLRNIGQFDNVAPPPQTALAPFSLFYAENGRGKTTLAAILRSFASGDPELILERHRLGARQSPHVVLNAAGAQAVFQNGEWSRTSREIAIFDDLFVSANVCSGIQLQTAHRQNLHSLILGARGVALNNALQGHVGRIEEHNAAMRELADAIPANARGPYRVDAFCNLEEDAEIDSKIEDAERRLAAARSADAIRQSSSFLEIRLPDFDMEAIDGLLARTLADLEAEALERVRTHFGKLGRGGEAWVADGMPRIEPASDGLENEACPFCAQDLAGSDLIAHYRAYFSEQYEALRAAIRQTGLAVRDAHSGDVPAAFEAMSAWLRKRTSSGRTSRNCPT